MSCVCVQMVVFWRRFNLLLNIIDMRKEADVLWGYAILALLNILLSITQESKQSFSTAVSPATKHSGSILFQFFKCQTLRDLQTEHLYYKLLQSQGQSYIVNMIGYHSTLHLSGQELTARMCLYFINCHSNRVGSTVMSLIFCLFGIMAHFALSALPLNKPFSGGHFDLSNKCVTGSVNKVCTPLRYANVSNAGAVFTGLLSCQT